MAKVNTPCCVHLLNRFRVNKGQTHILTVSCVLYRNAPTFLGKSYAPSVNGLYRMYSARDRATALHRVLAYSKTNMFSTPASCADTEIERGYRRKNVEFPSELCRVQGVILKSYVGVYYAWRFFNEDELPLLLTPRPPLIICIEYELPAGFSSASTI